MAGGPVCVEVYTRHKGDHDIVAKAVYGDYEAAAEAVRITGVQQEMESGYRAEFRGCAGGQKLAGRKLWRSAEALPLRAARQARLSGGEGGAVYRQELFPGAGRNGHAGGGTSPFPTSSTSGIWMMVRNSRADGSGVFCHTGDRRKKGNLYLWAKKLWQ